MKVQSGVTAARLVLFCVALALVITSSVSAESRQSQPPPRDGSNDISVRDPQARFVPRELLVRFKDGVSNDQRAEALRANGAERKRQLRIPGLELVRLAPGRGVEATARALANRPEVAYAEPNWIYRTSATPNDPRFNELWGLNQASDADIDAPEAWNTTTGNANIVVGVVDTGVAYLHTDLAQNIWANPGETGGGKETNNVDDDGNGYVDDHRGWDFVNGDNNPFDDNGHGTHVAGTIGAGGHNGVGVAGVNWNVRLMPLKFLGADGSGFTSDAVDAILYARGEGARVVNNSWGGGGFSQALLDAFTGSTNTLFFNAAGNSASNNDGAARYPCNYDSSNIVCVAATTSTDGLADFSNYGATTVDLAAPGVGILSTWPGNFTEVFSDGLENSFNNWTTGGTNNTWARTSEAAKTGSWSATDSPGALYLANTNSWMRTITSVNLAGRNGCVALFDMRLDVGDVSDLDWLFVEASTDGTTWQVIGQWYGNSGGDFWSAESDMSDFDGSSTVYLGFRLFTDNVAPVQAQGAHIDNIRIACASGGADNSYNSISGTSMATPHVAGVAALAWAKNPAVSLGTVKSALLNGGDPLAVLSGKTVSGRRLNANGTLALIPSAGPQTLTVVRAGTGAGTVTSVPAGIDCEGDCTEQYPAGTSVTLTATAIASPTSGSHLAGWEGCDSVVNGACIVQMNSAKNVTVTFTLGTFADVATSNPFFANIEQLFSRGITTGCATNSLGARLYCPGENVLRQQMAAFLIRAKGLTQLTPATPTFADVPASNPFYGYIERLYEQGITTGCGTNGSGQKIYCPDDNVLRQQMAAFLIRAKGLTPLESETPTFADVPKSNPFYGHIERLYQQGITTGCGRNASDQLIYCPEENVLRQQMAAFLIRAFPS